MKQINKKIFRSFLLISVLILISSIVLTMSTAYEYLEAKLQSELENKAYYISKAMENEGTEYLEDINIPDETIILVSPEGDILADTSGSFENKIVLSEYNKYRDIKQALESGNGTYSEYSSTLTEKIIYFSLRLDNGNVLRVSTREYTVLVILMSLTQPVAIVAFLILILSFWLCHRVSVKFVEPINQLDLENPENNDTYEELAPLLNKIANQIKTIDRQLKNAEQKQEEFRLITENMSEGFLVIDNSMRILTYNSSAMKLLNISKDDIENIFAVNRTKIFMDMMESVLSGKRTETEMNFDERIYRFIANPVFEEKKIIGAVIVILDVTESVKREQLRREFTSNISHELKTPLTSISGFAEIMTLGGTAEEDVIDFSKSIYDEAQRLINLVSDIINISELDEKAVPYEKEPVDLYELAVETATRLRSEADKKNVTINVSGQKAEVIGIRKILDEMIYNLCDNAVKYNKPNGKVDIIITQDDRVTLTVRDNGIGIPLSQQDRVFERFYRVDKGRSKAVGGTGLGLAIVKHGAAYHNAEIKLESEDNIGTSISIKF